jgi:hypothetical protein
MVGAAGWPSRLVAYSTNDTVMEEAADLSDGSSDIEPSWTQIHASSQLSLLYKHAEAISSTAEKAEEHAWDGPLRRASRWLDEDSCHSFYHTVLKDLGLPSTRSREVACWRIKKRVGEAANGGEPLPSNCLTITTYIWYV